MTGRRTNREDLARLYRPSPATLAAALHDVGEALVVTFNDVAAGPSLELCDRALSQLRSAQHAVERLRVALAEAVGT
jgi:hypothetical protein